MDSSPINEALTAEKKEVMTARQPEQKREVFTDRSRTNLLRGPEQKLLAFLCEAMPSWVTSDLMTFVGMLGSATVMLGLILAKGNVNYLFLSVLGFGINWFGDSLDGRLAYYRKKPRKWYGFTLDMNMDWFSAIMMGYGFYYYLPSPFDVFSFALVVFYGWTMIMALMKYKIVNVYVIDTAYLGPTEFRLILCAMLVSEVFLPGTAGYFTIAVTGVLFFLNTKDFIRLQKLGNERDAAEKENKKPE